MQNKDFRNGFHYDFRPFSVFTKKILIKKYQLNNYMLSLLPEPDWIVARGKNYHQKAWTQAKIDKFLNSKKIIEAYKRSNNKINTKIIIGKKVPYQKLLIETREYLGINFNNRNKEITTKDIVNNIRHEHTNYDELISTLCLECPWHVEAKEKIIKNVFNEISSVYPEYADESNNQLQKHLLNLKMEAKNRVNLNKKRW